eukprot:CAMPEP_0184505058 /NCGR_PEP_ID=MMETSP0113_2-20130426/52788_1 /TAXON_ID=91329 /ORGANISM="Norrisiella sphaerica, Strain BC52" /LENGTH=458 /DNA_ID=CAMNT_0026894727 /DNA_START=106 /DNA_END=1482 /DNA_ORIENTATION=-
MLCPTYKRMKAPGKDDVVRESSYPEVYRERLSKIMDMLEDERSDLYALQEMWVESTEVQGMFRKALKEQLRGYRILELKRTSHWSKRDDGVGFLIGPDVKVLDAQEIIFQDCGDRVALMVLILKQGHPMIVVNTHLLFPHHKYSTDIRLREVRKILCYAEAYIKENKLSNVPLVICGDFNGTPGGNVGKYMKNQGFELLCGSGKNDDSASWVSHRSHRGTDIFCDLIWVLNPSNKDKFCPQDWKDRVFAEIDQKIVERNLTLSEGFKKFFDQDSNDKVDPEEFREALRNLGFHGPKTAHLLDIEIDELIESADIDHNGLLDYKEFIDRFWRATSAPDLLLGISGTDSGVDNVKFLTGKETRQLQISEEEARATLESLNHDADKVFDIESIEESIVPKELAKGSWPLEWQLSDHGLVSSTIKLKPPLPDEGFGSSSEAPNTRAGAEGGAGKPHMQPSPS